ncbi:hypothetical protein BZA70DRAFT_109126 [Myxozyma melibiosi]|uniref:Zn(2)-C6 fungal-type domain-containing protein n=1 Tax=Myxozyma melibiosi TaxID=54550 RepID=A0ABR1F9U8_9ASCO
MDQQHAIFQDSHEIRNGSATALSQAPQQPHQQQQQHLTTEFPSTAQRSSASASPAREGSIARGGFPFKRSYKACLHCRERKVKCDLGSLENPSEPPCARCKREGRKCHFVPSRRGGAKNVRAGKARKYSDLANSEEGSENEDEDSGRANSEDNGPNGRQPKKSRAEQKITGSLIKDRGLHTAADALNILAHVADSAEGKDRGDGLAETNSTSQPYKRIKAKETHSRWIFRSSKLSLFYPVQAGIISESEVMILLRFFFETLHPFYPYIPPGLQPPNNLAAHPMLLVTILSISSRYCALPDVSGDLNPPPAAGMTARSKEVHSAIWTYGESLISQTVWAEASSISLATVLAFLLLSQWNPRSVHRRKGDYANPTHLPSNDEDGRGPEGGGGYGGFAAARRSDRMAWMMIGVAIRLAQDMNLFSKWREISLACFYSDITLALRLGRPSMLSYSFQETSTISFSALDNAKLDILRILSFAHQSLYSNPESMYKILNSDSYLPLLRYFRSRLAAWNTKYQLLIIEDKIERESLMLEYHYAELYIYSLALSPPGHRQVDGSLADLYILLATRAAEQIIRVIQRVYETGYLRWAPIHWFVRAIHAAIFLAKVLALERDPDPDRQQELISSIRGLASTLRDASPDDIHLATKYAETLFKLCDNIETELKKAAPQESDVAQSQGPSSQRSVPGSSDDATAHNGGSLESLGETKDVENNIFDSAYGATGMVNLEDMKWFIDSYGIGFDGNFTGEPEWLATGLVSTTTAPTMPHYDSASLPDGVAKEYVDNGGASISPDEHAHMMHNEMGPRERMPHTSQYMAPYYNLNSSVQQQTKPVPVSRSPYTLPLLPELQKDSQQSHHYQNQHQQQHEHQQQHPQAHQSELWNHAPQH